MEVIGLDIGGTNLKAGRVNNGKIEERVLTPVNRGASLNEVVNDLFKCIDMVITKNTQRIGVGVPAVVDSGTGVVYDVQNIPSWKEIALKEILHERYDLPVFINNDANCFAIGEKIYGKGRDFRNFIGLSIGTGIGMGIIINDSLYNGVLCGAGEIGMIKYKESILEDYAGSFFFATTYGKSAETLYKLALEGDDSALNAFKDYGVHLGEAIKTILYLYAPEAIVLGGSISKAYEFFQESIESALKSFAYEKQLENFKIEISKPGSAILGAAALCFQK